MTKVLSFDLAKYTQLKEAYDKAVEEKKDTFTLGGDEYVVGYAKYVLEYLSNKLRPEERGNDNSLDTREDV